MDDAARNPASTSGWAPLLLIALFWLAAFCSGYPAPFIDDIWYATPAVSLAEHGAYSNYVSDILAPIDSQRLFLAYLPLHSYVLAAWLKVFGVGAAPLRSFQVLAAAGASWALWHLLRPAAFRDATALLVSALVYVLLGGAGLRPDALALLLFLLGLRVYHSRRAAGYFLGCLFLALSFICSFNTAAVALLVVVSSLAALRWVRGSSWREVFGYAMAGATAFALVLLLFLWMIDFRLHDFLRCIAVTHADGSAGVRRRFMEQLFTPFWFSKWVVGQAALPLFCGIFWFRRGAQDRVQTWIVGLTLALGYGLFAGVSSGSATGAHWWAFGCMAGALFLATRPGMATGALLAGWCLLLPVFVYGHGHQVVEGLLAARPPVNQKTLILDQVRQLSPAPTRIYVDEYAWREIYDCRLPANGFDFVSARKPGGYATVANLPPDSVAILSVKNAGVEYSQRLGRPLRLFGHPVWGVFANPGDLLLIPRP